MIRKWAFILIHPSLPSRAEQIARARVWGLPDLGTPSPIVEDNISSVKRTTNWLGKMPNRAQFLAQMPATGVQMEIFFAVPRCIGFSAAQAESTIQSIWAAGSTVYVHSTGALYRDGDDISELLARIASQQNTANVKASLRRKSAAKRKPKQST
jgi:hypothetical protein